MPPLDRRRAFGAWTLSWFAYAAYYFGRKGFSASKKTLHGELGLSESTLGAIDSTYLAAYAAGQFLSGLGADRLGARKILVIGLLGSAAACALFGSASSAALFIALMLLNGLFQATGWPSATRVVAEWTTPENRGTVMSFWSTCYQVGGIAANALCGYLLVRYGWRSAFWGPAVLLGLMAVAIGLLLPKPPQAEAASSASGVNIQHAEAALVRAAQRDVLRSPTLWSYSASYFFIKFIRYAVLFWLPYFLATTLNYRVDLAANVASAFEVGGILGVIALGVISDRLGVASRIPLCSISLLGLALSLFAYSQFAQSGVLENVLLLGLIGACLFAPDSVLAGAAAQDAGGPRAFAVATGFVNGVGSLGGMAEGLIVPQLSARFGWGALFPTLLVLALAAFAALLPALFRQSRAATL